MHTQIFDFKAQKLKPKTWAQKLKPKTKSSVRF